MELPEVSEVDVFSLYVHYEVRGRSGWLDVSPADPTSCEAGRAPEKKKKKKN